MLYASESYVIMQKHYLFWHELGTNTWHHYVLSDQHDPTSELIFFRTYDMGLNRDKRSLLYSLNQVFRRSDQAGGNQVFRRSDQAGGCAELGRQIVPAAIPLSCGPSLSMLDDDMTVDAVIAMDVQDINELVREEYCYNCLRPNDTESRWLSVIDESHTWWDVLLCEYCYDRHLTTCDGCLNETLMDSCASINTGLVSIGDSLYCRECQDDRIVYCVSCDNPQLNENAVWNDTREEYFCPDCYEEGAGDDERIHYYSYTPYLRFNTADPKRLLHIGMELEMSFHENEDLEDVLDGLEIDDFDWFWYAKEDSSIDYGFELVTHPFQLAWMKEKSVFDLISNIEAKIDQRSRSCGTHIHMSKNAFTPAHLWKFLRVHRDQAEFLGKIGGRGTDAGYGSFTALNTLRKPEALKKTAQTKNWSDYISRMTAINLLPDTTMELRYPEGIKSAKDAWAFAEMAEALYDFTNEIKVADVQAGALVDTGYLVNWIEDNADKFPNLLTRVRKIVPVRKTLPSKEKN
jgi:hypothetical protein